MDDFWLYNKHRTELEYTALTSGEFRLKIDSETGFKFNHSEKNTYNTLYDWDQIKPSYNFFFEFHDNEKVVREQLAKSELNKASFVYIETLSEIPIIKTTTNYFIENWIDFVNANGGQGSICITDDFRLLMEFTDDAKYYLFSNFTIRV